MMFLAPLFARYGLVIAAVAAFGVMFAAWDHSRVNAGVRKEVVRVELLGEKTDARAQVAVKAARKKVDTEPDAALRKWCRDCDVR